MKSIFFQKPLTAYFEDYNTRLWLNYSYNPIIELDHLISKIFVIIHKTIILIGVKKYLKEKKANR